jgi:hypothetical protein
VPEACHNHHVGLGRIGLLLAVLALLTAPVLAGCGGEDENATEAWAGGVCSELSSWATSVEDAIASLTAGGVPSEDDVRTAVDDVSQATQDLGDGLGDLERPETEAGDEAQSEIESLETQLQEQVDAVESAVEEGGLPALSQITSAISAAVTAVTSTIESLGSLEAGEELRDAFENSEDCDSLREQIDEIGS